MIASETKEEEEKEEEELSLVSTKVPKARVRFSISSLVVRGAAKECAFVFVDFCFPFVLLSTLCVLHHARRRG